MDGHGGKTMQQRRTAGDAFELPSVLAQLDTDDPTEQRAAVETIHDAIGDQPKACIPTVPKLRGLLEQPSFDDHERVAYCLAELAAESPSDVAPSVDVLVSFAADNPTEPATRELLRGLETLAAEQSAAVVDHVETLAAIVDRRSNDDRWGVRVFAQLSRERPAALEPAVPVLTDALATTPEVNGTPALSALGRLSKSEASLPTLEFVEHAVALIDHDEASLRNNAIGCLADVAYVAPSAVEPARTELTDALECDDPDTRANAAVALARIAIESPVTIEDARESLLALLEDDHERVRASACVALGHGGLEAAADRLAALASSDPSSTVRERADWALARVSETPN
ncbi:HEAT repeat domain-containing protein [Natronorubrum aibiense]|uniref:HEAT repeat domain-containing protein n=1 Tax=Natronorubrum aibiense TaxID=348826 RepID=A0A5P9P6V1_9EURY|nr:HEAT repeat domain-containing protein [Natronorubrum aibiense]QFU83816.1 HEAT repeat domain-containing protein [Natronorubrum aibiense]